MLVFGHRCLSNLLQFLYSNLQHFLELSLKISILDVENLSELGNQLDLRLENSRKLRTNLMNEHSLEKLYNWLNERLSLLIGDFNFDAGCRLTILQPHSLDPDGQTFRYPIRTDGKSAWAYPTYWPAVYFVHGPPVS
jgi:hypothetical protein